MTTHGINRVMAPTSNEAGGYNNWYWYGTVWDGGANAWRADINISNFNGVSSNYLTHIYVYDNAENQGTKYDLGAVYIKAPGLSASELKIGDYIDYSPVGNSSTYSTKQDGVERSGYGNQTISQDVYLDWQVITVNGNTLTLISERRPRGCLYLQGANGYNNGVKLLNDACNSLYKNTTYGAIGRSATLEDIDSIIGHTTSAGIEYTPRIGNRKYPEIFKYEKYGSINGSYTGSLGLSSQNRWYSGSAESNKLSGKITIAGYIFKNYKDPSKNRTEYYLAASEDYFVTSQNVAFWLASRSLSYYNSERVLQYCMFAVNNGSMDYVPLYDSGGNGYRGGDGYHGIRPVIEIDLSRVYIGVTGSGTSNNPYSITAK